MPVDQDTFNLLKGFWEQAGGPPGRADLAASIAMAESSGCQWALAGPKDIRPVKQCTYRHTTTENSAGYWQVNLMAHPSYSAPSIFNPVTNARAAVAISDHGDDFGAWSTYTNGAYQQFLTQFAGQDALGEPPPGTPGGQPDTATVADGAWSDGWANLSGALGRTLPTALASSQRSGERTLRHLQRGRKVVR